MKCNSYHLFFSNLANKTRFAIVMSLKLGSQSVNEISKMVGGEQSNISHHLSKLVSCNIVFVRQEGKQRMYSLNNQLLDPILKIIDAHVTQHCDGCIHNLDNIKADSSANKYVLVK